MKGIEAIVAHIEADSRQECGALLQAAQRQAEELREHGRQKQARFADREHERMEEHLAPDRTEPAAAFDYGAPQRACCRHGRR